MHTQAQQPELIPVSRDHSESLVASVAQTVPDPRAGVFGPASMSWKINREAAMFLGAGRATLLQLAHPWVATAIAQHSNVLADPIARFHNTFRIVFAMVFGSLEQATGAARSLHRLHTRIEGQLTEELSGYPCGARYQANEIAALRWVYATLIETAVLAYESVMPPLNPAELNTYYAETLQLAALFGLPASAVPPDWAAFLGYCREMESSAVLAVTSDARVIAHSVLSGAGSWIKPPRWYRALTIAWLPERLRHEFGLEFGSREAAAAENARRWLPRVYRRFPASLRFVGPWHEAQARLSGRSAGALTRASNRFWIGDPVLPFNRAAGL